MLLTNPSKNLAGLISKPPKQNANYTLHQGVLKFLSNT
jgi:hypothetical protein